ncbi:MAG: phosphotransferase [Acidimicrobiia bacterium]|nr:phosphotransferase [Acidimicrobiia bacterium]
MKPWEQLTESGQLRRLRKLASRALVSYPIEPVRLRLVGGFTNVIYRVDTADRTYALRVDLHQDHSDGDVDNELAWLEAIAAETTLEVARPVRAKDGRGYVFAAAGGVPGERRCVLFEWIPGHPLADRLSEAGYYALGQLSAGLHIHGSGFTPPHQPLTWDRVFYWPEEVDPVVVFRPEMQRFIGTEWRRVLDHAIATVETAFDRLPPGEAQLIHGDLHPWNVHTYRSRLIAFDFEDVTWGHRVQDIATTLFYERSHDAYADLRTAFEEGYRSVAPWPAQYSGEIEHFMAARSLMFVNYVANLRADPSEYYEVVFPRLERFLADWAG